MLTQNAINSSYQIQVVIPLITNSSKNKHIRIGGNYINVNEELKLKHIR